MPDLKKSLEERLASHPSLKAKIESLLAVVEDAAGKIDKAGEVEELVIEELRQMGKEALQDWAIRKEQAKKADFVEKNNNVESHSKKNSGGIRPLDR